MVVSRSGPSDPAESGHALCRRGNVVRGGVGSGGVTGSHLFQFMIERGSNHVVEVIPRLKLDSLLKVFECLLMKKTKRQR